jgi:hypothetical protein
MDMASLVQKLARLFWILPGLVLLAPSVNGPAFAESIVRREPAILAVQALSNAPFTPWCARHSYLCVSRPEVRFSEISIRFYSPQTERVRLSTKEIVSKDSTQVR